MYNDVWITFLFVYVLSCYILMTWNMYVCTCPLWWNKWFNIIIIIFCSRTSSFLLLFHYTPSFSFIHQRSQDLFLMWLYFPSELTLLLLYLFYIQPNVSRSWLYFFHITLEVFFLVDFFQAFESVHNFNDFAIRLSFNLVLTKFLLTSITLLFLTRFLTFLSCIPVQISWWSLKLPSQPDQQRRIVRKQLLN